jgi:hypothetical protein
MMADMTAATRSDYRVIVLEWLILNEQSHFRQSACVLFVTMHDGNGERRSSIGDARARYGFGLRRQMFNFNS